MKMRYHIFYFYFLNVNVVANFAEAPADQYIRLPRKQRLSPCYPKSAQRRLWSDCI